MSNVLAQLFVEFRASTDKLNSDIRSAQREFREFEKTVKPTTKLLDDMGAAALKAGTVLTASLTAPIAAIAGIGVSFNAMKEQSQIAFTTMLGSGEKAAAFLKELQDFAAKTPFEFPDLVRGSQRLMAMGFAAEQVRPLLTAVGDAAAGLGAGAEVIDRVTLALGQMQGRGKVATQEMNQLTEAGIPAWEILAKAIGVTQTQLRELVEKGAVPAGAAVNALVDGMNEKFGGMMAKQATTFNGLISTIKDEARFLAGELTTGLFNTIKGPLETVTKFMHDLRESMKGWSDGTKTAIVATGLLAASFGPLLIALGGTAFAVSSLITLYGQLGLASGLAATGTKLFAAALTAIPFVAVGVAALAAAKIFYDIYQTQQAWAESARQVNDAQNRQFLLVERSIANLKELGITIDRTGKSQVQLEEEVRKVTQAYYKEHPAAKAAADSHKDLGLQIDLEAAARKKLRDAIDSVKDSVLGNKESTRALTIAVTELTAAHVPLPAIAAQLSSRFLDEANTAKLLGTAIDPLIAKFAAIAMAQKAIRDQGPLQLLPANLDGLNQAFEANEKFLETVRQFNLLKLAMHDPVDAQINDLLHFANLQADVFGDFMDGEKARAKLFKEVTAELIAGNETAQKDAQEKAKSYQRIWEQATANVASDFVKGFSDVIFHAKNFGQAMKDIALNAAESMFKAFMTGLFSPLTSAMSSLGRSLADVLTGGIGGKGGLLGKGLGALGGILGIHGTAAAAAGFAPSIAGGIGTASIIGVTSGTGGAAAGAGAAGAAGGASGGLGASMAAFATNPITLAVAGAIAAGLAIHHFVGRGRRSANEFVQGAENPFRNSLSSIVDSFDSMKKAGSLTLEQAQKARDSAQELWRSFLQSNAQFAAQGKTQAKVAEQSLNHLRELFGPNLSKVFDGMDTTIAGLKGHGGSGIPSTGLAQSASTRFAAAVDKLIPAFDSLVAAVAGVGPGGTQLTVTNEFAPVFTFYGVPESLQQQIREQIEPQLISDLSDNTRGITEKVKSILGL